MRIGRWFAAAAWLTSFLQAPAQADIPSIKGSTTIMGEGSVVVTLAVAAETPLDGNATTVEANNPVLVFVETGPCTELNGRPILCGGMGIWLPAGQGVRGEPSWHWLFQDPSEVSGGSLRVYIVSEGPARVTLNFPDLAGSTTVTATTPAQGSIRNLENRCTGNCFSHQYGGGSESLTAPGQVMRLIIREDNEKPAVGSAPVQGCYENDTTGARDEDNPHGCDGTLDASDDPDRMIWAGLLRDAEYASELVDATPLYVYNHRYWVQPGRHYLGWRGHRIRNTEGRIAVFGAWIQQARSP